MKKLGVRLFSCSSDLGAVRQLHARLIRTDLHIETAAISDVVRSYALSPSHLVKAGVVFDHIHRPIFNHLIRGLSQDHPIAALRFYSSMLRRGLSPTNSTLVFVLKACVRSASVACGIAVHAQALKLAFAHHLFVSNALIRLYSTAGNVQLARNLFDEMPHRDVVSWNTLICGYSHCGRYSDVLMLFNLMLANPVKPDAVTMVKIVLASTHLGDAHTADRAVDYVEQEKLKVDVYLGNTLIDFYGRRGSAESARKVFDQMLDRNLVSWNAMIKAYTRAGDLSSARSLFDRMPWRDVISWTSMITGYSHANRFSDSVKLFQEMMAAQVKPDKVTAASVLSACANLGSLELGQAIHDYIESHDMKTDVYVGNALIDMYCKCASVEKAMEVFLAMGDEKDQVSWSSIITGLAVNGYANHVLQLFSEMLAKGIRPTHGTFVGILLACAHAGLVDKGLELFGSMEQVYGLRPEMKHYGCIADLLSRSGNLERAYKFIEDMPVMPDVVIWRILLSACKVHGNVELAERVTRKLLELDPSESGNYVLLSNAYASIDRWEDAMSHRSRMEESDVHKPSALSSIH